MIRRSPHLRWVIPIPETSELGRFHQKRGEGHPPEYRSCSIPSRWQGLTLVWKIISMINGMFVLPGKPNGTFRSQLMLALRHCTEDPRAVVPRPQLALACKVPLHAPLLVKTPLSLQELEEMAMVEWNLSDNRRRRFDSATEGMINKHGQVVCRWIHSTQPSSPDSLLSPPLLSASSHRHHLRHRCCCHHHRHRRRFRSRFRWRRMASF